MVKVRIKFSADIVIEGETLSDVKENWERMPLWSKEALDSGVDFCEELLIEDAETYEDIENEWNEV